MVIGIAGLGLIGGSLALRLKEKHTILGADPDAETADYALRNGYVSAITDTDGFRGCDVVFVAAPLDRTADCVRAVYRAVGDTAVITDVASVKSVVPEIAGARIVGGHPMAGTEFSGIRAAKAHLFENAYYVLVRGRGTAEADFRTVESLVRELGACPVTMTAEEHDRQAAEVSHMPHMVSYALASVPSALSIAGTGFYDMTRIAASDPAFWRSVIAANRGNTLAALNAVSRRLDEMRAALESGDDARLQALFADGRAKRAELESARPHLEAYCLYTDIKDEVGALERISGLLAAENINVAGFGIVNSREGAGGALRLVFKTAAACDRAAEILQRSGYVCNT